MPETTDAQAIVNMHKKGDIRDAVIEGPFGFDVAVSREAAEHKKIKSEIAGDVDFILMPNISAANIWAKGLMYFAGAKGAGIVAGAQRPVVMLSRADDSEAKLNSIALGVAVSKSHHTEP
jgi:phosphate butyryltransferase